MRQELREAAADPPWSGPDIIAAMAQRSGPPRLVAGLAAVALATAAYRGLDVSNPGVVSTTFLLVVLTVAATSPLWVAIAVSVVAVLAFNYFFLPPLGTFVVDDPQNWFALVAFLAVSLVASRLSAIAADRTAEALARRDEQARLFDLSRDVLVLPDSREALTALARAVQRRFALDAVAIAVPAASGGWEVSQAGAMTMTLDPRELGTALAAAQTTLEFDAATRTYAGHREVADAGRTIRLVPLRAGTKAIGLLAATGRAVDPGTLDALAGVAAIAIERATLLDERKAAERTRQSDELKSALLASIGHDLRTPLTAIRVAAANLQDDALSATDRHDQGELIQGEVERLARLFQNLMDMARIDAGALAHESRRVFPSEIVAAARDQVEHALGRHEVAVAIDPDLPVPLDPRLTASALAHLLENAAHYAPAGTTIDVTASVGADGLTIGVRDRGPGLAPADVPHLFDRFYRGRAAAAHASGSGMGLWLARGFLAAQGGRVWAENAAGGGARFTMLVPTRRDTEPSQAMGEEPA